MSSTPLVRDVLDDILTNPLRGMNAFTLLVGAMLLWSWASGRHTSKTRRTSRLRASASSGRP
ncbi:MAG: hypothetical protein AB7I30_18530 [Isosphaeraceae bacterium]